jgi:hypothetical protein
LEVKSKERKTERCCQRSHRTRQCLRTSEMDQGGAGDFQKDAGKSLVDFKDDVGYRKGSSQTEQLNSPADTPNQLQKCDVGASCYMRWKKDARMRIMRRNRDESFESFESEMTLHYTQVVIRRLQPGMRPRRRRSWQQVHMIRQPTAGRRWHAESARERRSLALE